MATAQAARSIAREARGRRRRFSETLTGSILPRVVLIVGCVIFLMPFYWMVVSALKSNTELTANPPTLLPSTWVFKNFVDAVNFIPFGLYAFNSLVITFGATVGAVLSNTVVAYGFSRINWRGRNALFYLCVGTVFLPYPVVLIALVDTFGKLGWVDTFLPLIVPAFLGNPFYIFLMRQFMLGHPKRAVGRGTCGRCRRVPGVLEGDPAAYTPGRHRGHAFRRRRGME